MKQKWRLYTYDVWGNKRDGYEVNDVFSTGQTIELEDKDFKTDKTLHTALKREGLHSKRAGYFTFEGEYDNKTMNEIIYINRTSDSYPEGELRHDTLKNPARKARRKK